MVAPLELTCVSGLVSKDLYGMMLPQLFFSLVMLEELEELELLIPQKYRQRRVVVQLQIAKDVLINNFQTPSVKTP